MRERGKLQRGENPPGRGCTNERFRNDPGALVNRCGKTSGRLSLPGLDVFHQLRCLQPAESLLRHQQHLPDHRLGVFHFLESLGRVLFTHLLMVALADNPDTQMLSRGRAPSALKRPLARPRSGSLDHLPDLCAQAPATALLAAPVNGSGAHPSKENPDS